ncbi:4145_t:CDS:2 [Acaulospora morrowiae]|uniref:rhizopuspepsin n=1 Tax=Acaulospora morrowiae TaxID=94023 RepID=A0A9N9B4R4_9GLOM|nr:4145_t:CDS:2 [Acaulospora morrowiae]
MKPTHILIITLVIFTSITFAIIPPPSIIRLKLALRNVTSTPNAVQDCKKKFHFKLLNLHNCIYKRANQKNTPKKKIVSQSGTEFFSTSSETDFTSTSTRISSPTIISSTGASTSSKSITSTSTSSKSITSTSTSSKTITSTSTSSKTITSTSTSKSVTISSTSASTSTKSIPSTSLSSKSVTKTTISLTRTSTSTKVSSTSIPKSTPSPMQIQAVGVIGLTNDVEWVAQIAVGTPPQPFLISIDTASADLWIPSIKCTKCGKSRLFNPQKSSTFTAINSRFQIQYADGGSATGLVEQDTIQIGYMNIKNQKFAMVDNLSQDFMADVVDGIMGLGYDSLAAATGTSTPLSNMLNQGLIPRAIFSVQLRPARIKSSYGGEFTFGGVDTSLFTGPITYTSVTQQLYWQISIDGVEMNGQIISGSQQVIVDTGTSLMVLGTDVVNNIIKTVKGRYDSSTGTWQVPCNMANGANAVKIAIRINNVAWTINPLDLVRERVSRSNKFCYSGMVSTDENVWILGGVFLKNVYVSNLSTFLERVKRKL